MSQVADNIKTILIKRHSLMQSIRLNVTIFFLVPIIIRCFDNDLTLMGWSFIVLGTVFVISVSASRLPSLNYLQLSADGISLRIGIRPLQIYRWDDMVTKLQTFQIPGDETVCIGFDWSDKYKASLGSWSPSSSKAELGYDMVIMEAFQDYSSEEVASLINQHRESFSKITKSYDNKFPPQSSGHIPSTLGSFS
jgi:hypothetical protein